MTKEPELNPFDFKLEWYWRVGDDGRPDCGIYFSPRDGHGYAVARCPKYLDEKTWSEYAEAICSAVNKRATDAVEVVTVDATKLLCQWCSDNRIEYDGAMIDGFFDELKNNGLRIVKEKIT